VDLDRVAEVPVVIETKRIVGGADHLNAGRHVGLHLVHFGADGEVMLRVMAEPCFASWQSRASHGRRPGSVVPHGRRLAGRATVRRAGVPTPPRSGRREAGRQHLGGW